MSSRRESPRWPITGLAVAGLAAASLTCAAPAPRKALRGDATDEALARPGASQGDGHDGHDGHDGLGPQDPQDRDGHPGAMQPAQPALEVPAGALDALFSGLRAAESGAADGRVLISIFGDSHTAGDRMTARLRRELAARFGDAGRGLVAMGKPPFRHYYQTDVRYGSSGKWKVAVGGRREDSEPFGLAGLRMSTSDRRAQSWVETCAECASGGKVARFELLYWAAPGAAKLRVRVDEERWRTLAAPTAERSHAARVSIAVAEGAHRLTVEPRGVGALGLFGVALELDRPGVIIDGLGVVGRTLAQLSSWDWEVIGAQLQARAPRLVVLQYGTNEADHEDLDLGALAAGYDRVIGRIRAAVPAASILLLGPPDMAVRAAGEACDPPRQPRRDRRSAKAKKAPAPPPPALSPAELPVECQWRTPPRLLDIVAVQRAAAQRNGAAFFDSLAALGGPDRIEAMVTAEPPLAFRDRVHLTSLGYQRWAELLLSELLAAYELWQQTSQEGPSAPPPRPGR
ncbi:MAG: hypothetical protein IPI49_26585 [Myxococcales bacterium]|nr:hypothetical protein [Myxococcales bacterium]